MKISRISLLNLAVIQFYIVISTADKEDISETPAQHHLTHDNLHSKSSEAEETAADNGDIGQEFSAYQHFLDDHGSLDGQTLNFRDLPGDYTDIFHPRLYGYTGDAQSAEFPDDLSKRRLGSAKNTRYGTWTYIPKSRNPRSVANEDISSFESSDIYPDKRMLGSALNVRYGTWKYGNLDANDGEALYDTMSKRPSQAQRRRGPVMNRWQAIWGSPGKRANRPVMNRWQAIWGSPGKKASARANRPVINRWQSIWGSPGKREDAEDGWHYLSKDDSLFSDDTSEVHKRPMGIGPAINWSKFISRRDNSPTWDIRYKK